MGYNIKIKQADKLNKVRRFINRKGEVVEGGIEDNLGGLMPGIKKTMPGFK